MSKLAESELRDELFFSDLVYAIKKTAGLEVPDDEKTNERIELRRKNVEIKCEDVGYNVTEISDFQMEEFFFAMTISKMAGVRFKSPYDIAKYPELVKEALQGYKIPTVKQQDDSKRFSLGTYPNNNGRNFK